MLEATAEFAADAGSVADARSFARGVLAEWDRPDLDWALLQLVSELATNAVLHARTAYEVTISVAGDAARLAVRDRSARKLQPRNYATDATTGRGLALVQRMGRDWGIDTHADGKTVWVQVDATPKDFDVESDALLAAFEDLDASSGSSSPTTAGGGAARGGGASNRLVDLAMAA